MAFDSNRQSLDRDVDESMRMFERSQVGPAPEITPVRPARILLALDGSPQDATSIAAAQYLREQVNVETLILDLREFLRSDTPDSSADPPVRIEEMVKQISGARPIQSTGDEPYERILQATKDHQLDMLIVPSPFGRSFDKIGVDSIGTVLDVLLARCSVPTLVIRRDDQRLDECVGRIALVVGSECDIESRAAAWCFGLAGPSAQVTLNLVLEKEQFENLRSIIQAMDPEGTLSEQQVSDALAKSHHALHGSMLKTATARKLAYRLVPQAGEVAPPNPLNDTVKQLLVMPLEVDDRFGQGFAQDRIRRSPHPVLVVPSHVVDDDE
ncbi:universal stress protein [Crateriforma conspicua]|uniref:Universal stress protein family protein n=1 Tax=Crateriforma conspicua TaxID=2527996 RepID=A0A5C6FMQ8_9PLAN|nr:universal stress protein [Crateriforma conspicua]TWU61643.1 Universal stress protein family protein [Crateriforma conspicua]